VGLKPL